MAPRHRDKERLPAVAVLGWPLVAATPVLLVLVRTGDPKIDPMLRLGFAVPALAAMLWAFSRISETRKYRKVLLVLLLVAGAEFLGLFLYFFATISAGPVRPTTQPTETQQTAAPPQPLPRAVTGSDARRHDPILTRVQRSPIPVATSGESAGSGRSPRGSAAGRTAPAPGRA